jgi:hypothetical protein
MYSHCIVGAGVSGLILLLLLAETGIPLDTIVVIDPYFDGGDLARKWSTVISNTPWSKTYTSLKDKFSSIPMPVWAQELPMETPTSVLQIARLLREMARPLFNSIRMIQGLVKEAKYDTTFWTIQTQKGQNIETTNIYFTFGSDPSDLDLPIPTIPLEVALNAPVLASYIQPTDTIIVFGTAHSGTLILKNLADLRARAVGIYRGEKPFHFARDGVYTGIKMDAEQYADEILEGKYPTIKLVNSANISDIIRETRKATWCIYATGFERRSIIRLKVNGEEKDLGKYSATTGKLTECPNAWGFGIAYPSQAPDGIHFDVGVSSFIEHIAKQLINLKNT